MLPGEEGERKAVDPCELFPPGGGNRLGEAVTKELRRHCRMLDLRLVLHVPTRSGTKDNEN